MVKTVNLHAEIPPNRERNVAHRAGIRDGAEFARELRADAWKRPA